MSVYLGKNKVGVTILAPENISAQNIDTYKYQDLTRVVKTGGPLATNEQYERVEEYLQSKYSLIMGG